ncbi:hypothetical protein FDP41_002012 [Naegleria fowleri]|uniref:Uncharacterized protein n=1 Tax=Naegleria fowleri TaxID=5763 RepID=A0A6A5BWD2_NAEFO|nr:uncharacterized protein FDP41_002012 [Naegleria fowleri]KAF0978942.1 hypothetical protein FDP41_002012 [Naegleria fowleri]CAG4718895.1 unnamed protein product [Naegleria fowleri]
MGLKDVFKDMKKNVKSIDSTIDRTDQELDHVAKVLDDAEELIDQIKDTVSHSDQLMNKMEGLLDHSDSLMHRVESTIVSDEKFSIMFRASLLLILMLSMWISQMIYVSMFDHGIGVMTFLEAFALRISQAILFLIIFRLIIECGRYVLFQKFEFKETEKKRVVNGTEEIVTRTYELVPSSSTASTAAASANTASAATTTAHVATNAIASASNNIQNEQNIQSPSIQETAPGSISPQLQRRESTVENGTQKTEINDANAGPSALNHVPSRVSSSSSSLAESVKLSKDFVFPNEPTTKMVEW